MISANQEEMDMEKKLLLVHEHDDAAVALSALFRGETCEVAGKSITLLDDIPFGHKVAL